MIKQDLTIEEIDLIIDILENIWFENIEIENKINRLIGKLEYFKGYTNE